LKTIDAAILLALLPLSEPACAQARDKTPDADRPLLATFCDAANIKGSACTRAKGYRSGKRCDVKLQPDRYSGKFLADGSTLLVVNYESGCERSPHRRSGNRFGPVMLARGPEPKGGPSVATGALSPACGGCIRILSESLNPFAD